MEWTDGPAPSGQGSPPPTPPQRRPVAALHVLVMVAVVGAAVAGGAYIGRQGQGARTSHASTSPASTTPAPAVTSQPSPTPGDNGDLPSPGPGDPGSSAGCPASATNHAEPPAAMFTGNASGPVITPAQATQVVATFWPARERALVADDPAATDAVEAGPAAEYDDAVSCAISYAHDSVRIVRPLPQMRVFVPVQNTYPARFLAEVLTTTYPNPNGEAPPGSPYLELFVFSRPDPASPWKAVIDTGATGGGFDDVAIRPGGFDADPPHPTWVDPAGVPAELAAYWQHWKDLGGPPPGTLFASGRWTTIQGESLETGKVTELDRGVVDHVTYSADPRTDGLYQFAVDQNFELECFTVRYRSVLTPAYWALHQDLGRINYGGLLAPGDYTRIDVDGLHQSCAFLAPSPSQPLNGAGPGIGVVGGTGGEVTMSGVPAPVDHTPPFGPTPNPMPGQGSGTAPLA